MINGYEIKYENNEEILYLYLDFNKEFSKLNSKNKKIKLNEEINKYLKQNRINFKGTKACIIASGFLIGTLFLNAPLYKLDDVKIDNHVIALINENEPSDNKMIDSVIEVSKKELKKESTPKVQKNNVKTKVKETKNKEEVKEEKISHKNNKTYVIVKRSNGFITNIELEEYVIGVVAAEMPASFHEEALKSQAIIARTYAVNTLNTGKILTDNSSTQNYKDNDELKKMWGSNYNMYYKKIKDAVESTKGLYLTYNGRIIDAVYHSTSNGQTEDARFVWGNSKPYLVSVESIYDNDNKNFSYEKFIAYDELSKKLNMKINENVKINILSYTSGNRVEKISIDDKIFTGVEIRSLLSLRSADFTFEIEDNGISFKTKGYGHGVGLSQYGANGMAKKGSNFEQILKHYYKGVKLANYS